MCVRNLNLILNQNFATEHTGPHSGSKLEPCAEKSSPGPEKNLQIHV